MQNIGPCQITGIYVSWPPNETLRFGVGGDRSSAGNTPEVEKFLERDLKEKCVAVFGDRSVDIRVVPTWSSEHTQLIERAITDSADVIVVGTSQKKGMKRFWLGSVSPAILRHAPTNVICVPNVAGEKTADRVGAVPSFERVLVPIDFSESSVKAISLAFKTVKQGGEVCLLHVTRPTAKVRAKRRNRNWGYPGMHRNITEELQALAPPETRQRKVRKRVEVVEHEHPALAITQAAERFGADLICFGAQRKSKLKNCLFGSTTKSVMRRSSRPIMIMQS